MHKNHFTLCTQSHEFTALSLTPSGRFTVRKILKMKMRAGATQVTVGNPLPWLALRIKLIADMVS